jgi:hypothetical protein
VLYVWNPVYVDALVLRYRDADSNGTFEEKLYVGQEANFNVTALFLTRRKHPGIKESPAAASSPPTAPPHTGPRR